jgi:hypothetical protein
MQVRKLFERPAVGEQESKAEKKREALAEDARTREIRSRPALEERERESAHRKGEKRKEKRENKRLSRPPGYPSQRESSKPESLYPVGGVFFLSLLSSFYSASACCLLARLPFSPSFTQLP